MNHVHVLARTQKLACGILVCLNNKHPSVLKRSKKKILHAVVLIKEECRIVKYAPKKPMPWIESNVSRLTWTVAIRESDLSLIGGIASRSVSFHRKKSVALTQVAYEAMTFLSVGSIYVAQPRRGAYVTGHGFWRLCQSLSLSWGGTSRYILTFGLFCTRVLMNEITCVLCFSMYPRIQTQNVSQGSKFLSRYVYLHKEYQFIVKMYYYLTLSNY